MLLTPLTSNDYTIKDLFSFSEEVSSFDCAHYMTSFDTESLFTNIPLEKTINICVENFSIDKTKVNNLTKESLQTLLELATLDSFFIFDGKYYKQKDGVAMGSHWVQLWLMCLYVISKNNEGLIALLVINLFHIEGMLTIHFCCFHLNCA